MDEIDEGEAPLEVGTLRRLRDEKRGAEEGKGD